MLVEFVFLAFVAIFLSYFLYRLYRCLTNGHALHWLRAKCGLGRSLARLAQLIEWDADELKRFEPSYSEAVIPKRSGGSRRLLIPDERTKQLQRQLLRRVLRRLRSHPAAIGFEHGRSIVDHARPHTQQAVVVCMDVVDFFPATQAQRIEKYFRRIGWNRAAATLLTRLTTHEEGLPQGAPTSPRLSNLVNFGLDAKFAGKVTKRGGHYTRYADDIVISFAEDCSSRVREVIQYVRRTLPVYGYRMHDRRKLHVRRRHQRQIVTGLVVNDGVDLPRPTRRWLRAVEHRQQTGQNATLTPSQLAGWRALEQMVKAPPKTRA